MLGLILKDLYTVKKQFKILGLLIIFYFVIAIADKNVSFLAFAGLFINIALCFGVFGYDEKGHFDKYTAILPVSNKMAVAVRYLETLLLAVIITVIIIPASNLIESSADSGNLQVMMVLVSMGVVLSSIMFPLIYKMGVEKARIGLFGIVLIPFLLVLLCKNFMDFDSVIEFLNQDFVTRIIENLHWIAPAIAIVFLFISYFISAAIVERKEY